MADIDFGFTQGEQLATLIRVVRDLHRDIYGNGEPGLKRKAESFMDMHNATEKERVRQHRENSRKLNVIIALLTAIAAYIGLILSVGKSLKSDLDPIKIFHSHSDSGQVYATDKKPQMSMDQ